METVEIITEQVLVLEDGCIEIIAVAEQGPPGPQGVPGPTGGSALQYIAAEALGGHRVVVLNDFERAIYATNLDSMHAVKVLGITLGAADFGDLVTVQTGGEITEPSWSWTLGQPIYLGDNGQLTQAYPAAGFALIVAFPISATKIMLRIREPIVIN